MKKTAILLIVMSSIGLTAQTKTELKKHFELYYSQMKKQGDVQGIINAMTHLDVIEPSQARKDTLAYIYVSEGRNLEALNTIGIEINPTDTNINVEVKAIALKALNQPARALEQYEVLFERQPSPNLAYELADLKLQTQDLPGATANIEYGLANVKDDMVRTFYETQQPYQTSLKAALLYLKALTIFSENQNENVEASLAIMNRALAIDPNFNMAKVSKDALLSRKKE
jgi:tetratricopeptide (TPR) repeat protein